MGTTPKHWSAEWAATVADAQEQITTSIAGATFNRVRYGADFPEGAERCRDCGVEKGQLHVPDRCCVERCPRCGGQAIGCNCHDAAHEARVRRRPRATTS